MVAVRAGQAPPLVVVTGANRGIGLHACRWLAARGAGVVLVARDRGAGESARQSLEPSPHHRVVVCDLADPESVQGAATEILEGGPAPTGLVNNAAVLPQELRVGPLGVELQMAVNHLGHFLLTRLLHPALREAPAGRVVTVTSRSHRGPPVTLEDPGYKQRRYDRLVAYQQSKLANVAFSLALARRVEGTALASLAVHPGVYGTGLLGDWTGLGSVVRLGVAGPKRGGRWVARWALGALPGSEDLNGAYFEKGTWARPSRSALDEGEQERLWRWSETTLGLPRWPVRSGEALAPE
ncbi:MAG: SDR family NAD(P)-dependent oxidoreductase [Gemmatimonadetes bacterium]|nr:SDR family NAD(P)-dependent oxidoreductase [Gemmatimonadota bacterium]